MTPRKTRWTGTYRYSDTGINEGVDFRMELLVDASGNVTGIIDDGPNGIPEPATIEGRIEGSTITFVKRYQSPWIVDATGELVRVPDQPSHELHYVGEIDDVFMLLDGTWTVDCGAEGGDTCASGGWAATREP